MKFLKGLFATLLILIILGGLGYIGYTQFFMGNMNHQSMTPQGATASPTPQPTQNQQSDMQHGGHASTGNAQNAIGLGAIAIQNRDRLNQAIGTINQALDLITIDPYSKTTLPSQDGLNMGAIPGQNSQGTGTINIYPNDNSTVTIAPNGAVDNPGAVVTPDDQNNGTSIRSYVYDQSKLQQLHNGIYSLAQGVALVNQLNNDLLTQSGIIEGDLSSYQTYIQRYTLATRNKTKLTNALSLLSQASTLINVNPYGAPDGYAYDPAAMQQLHQGVFKLAQGIALLGDLNEAFTSQMLDATNMAQSIVNSYNQSSLMSMSGTGLLSNINLTTVFNFVLILMIIGLIGGIIGAIFSVFKKSRPEFSDPDKGPNYL